jgi:hypothetical protein
MSGNPTGGNKITEGIAAQFGKFAGLAEWQNSLGVKGNSKFSS